MMMDTIRKDAVLSVLTHPIRTPKKFAGMLPGNANLPICGLHDADREIGIPGFQTRQPREACFPAFDCVESRFF